MSRFASGCAAVVLGSMLLACTASSGAAVPTARGATDASARKTAKIAVATMADLGAGWTQYRKAEGVQKFGKNDCTSKAGSPITASDTGYVGAMFRDETKTLFAYSTSTVFRTEADAKAYTAVLTTPAFQTCRVAEDDAAQKKSDPKTFVEIYETSTSAVPASPGLEAYYSESAGGKDANGQVAPTAEYLRFTFRHGRVVYSLKLDTTLPAADEASQAAWSDRIDNALTGMNSAIEARLTAAGV